MPKKNTYDDHILDLNKGLDFAFGRLEKAAKSRNDDLHLLVLSTIDSRFNPQARTVVIREFDKDNLSLRFHTDSRSTKLFEISSNKKISLLGYDSKNKLQIRISGEAEIIKIDKILKEIWGKMHPMSRECYRVTEAPGKEVNTIDEVMFEEEGKDGNNGFKNFSVVNCHITSLETLYLHSAGHIRCLYENNNNELIGKWIVP